MARAETPALLGPLKGATATQHKPSLWLRYFDDTFVVWPHGPERLHNFLSNLNNSRLSIQFTTERESDTAIPPLDVLVIKEETTLATKVYRKPTHTLTIRHMW
jgi:hypothetical protein